MFFDCVTSWNIDSRVKFDGSTWFQQDFEVLFEVLFEEVFDGSMFVWLPVRMYEINAKEWCINDELTMSYDDWTERESGLKSDWMADIIRILNLGAIQI